jgi:NAD(P)H-dependent FMN reductase
MPPHWLNYSRLLLYYWLMKLMVILGSTRQARRGEVVAKWVTSSAAQDGRFEIDYVDLRELNLPWFDEPLSPFAMYDRGQDYTHPEGKAWAQRVGQAEGVLIVTPEYNHGYSGVLKNALDWVGREWGDKPVAYISYGNITAGARAVEQLRQVTIELGLVQVANAIYFPNISKDAFDGAGQPSHSSANDNLKNMFDELLRLHRIFSQSKS